MHVLKAYTQRHKYSERDKRAGGVDCPIVIARHYGKLSTDLLSTFHTSYSYGFTYTLLHLVYMFVHIFFDVFTCLRICLF